MTIDQDVEQQGVYMGNLAASISQENTSLASRKVYTAVKHAFAEVPSLCLMRTFLPSSLDPI